MLFRASGKDKAMETGNRRNGSCGHECQSSPGAKKLEVWSDRGYRT